MSLYSMYLYMFVCVCVCMNLYEEMHVCVMHKCADSNCVSTCFALTVLRSCVRSLGGCLRCRLSSEGYRASIPWRGSCWQTPPNTQSLWRGRGVTELGNPPELACSELNPRLPRPPPPPPPWHHKCSCVRGPDPHPRAPPLQTPPAVGPKEAERVSSSTAHWQGLPPWRCSHSVQGRGSCVCPPHPPASALRCSPSSERANKKPAYLNQTPALASVQSKSESRGGAAHRPRCPPPPGCTGA